MATAASVLAQIQKEQTDITALQGLVGNLITAFEAAKNGTLTQAQLDQISTALTADDASVATISTSIQNALGTAPPVTPTPAPAV